MRSNIYILFGFLAGIAVVCIAVFTVIVATSHAVSPSDFPVYAYSEYIDRTSSMTFTADGGAQLYEAEKAELTGATAESNALASGGSAAGGMEDGSVRRDLDLEMVYLNLVNLLTGGVNFRILIDEATQMKIIRSSAEILLYYVKNSGR